MRTTSPSRTRRAAMLGLIAPLAWSSLARAQLPPGDWKLRAADEFDGTSLDTAKWNYNYPVTFGNGGHAHNHAAWVTERQVRVGGGILSLVAEKRRDPAAPRRIYADGEHHVLDYTSGAVNSRGKLNFTGGYVEARMNLTQTVGSWPAFWMLQEGWPPEIDIMEFPVMDHDPADNDQYRYYTNYHWGTLKDRKTNGRFNPRGENLGDSWHNYGLRWEPNKLTYYLDGREVHSVSGEGVGQAADEYLLLNYAVGGWAGVPREFPAGGDSFDVDWVRVWQHGGDRVQTHWTNASGGSLDDARNWTNGVPDLQGAWAFFDANGNGNGNGDVDVDWNASRTMSDVALASDANYTLGTGDESIMFVRYSDEPSAWLTVGDNFAGTHTINARVELRDDTKFANFAKTPLTINGDLIGGGRFITRASGGEIVLNGTGTNTASVVVDASPLTVGGTLYAGVVHAGATVSVVNGGTLELADLDADLGNLPGDSARLLLDGGTLRLTGRSNTPRGFTIGGKGATVAADAGSDVTLHDAGGPSRHIASSNGGTLTLAGAGDARFDKRLGGTGGLTKRGTGTWTVTSADNSYTGATQVLGGTLDVGVGAKLGDGGAVDVSGGTLNFAKTSAARGNDQVVGPLTVAGGGLLDVGNSRVFTSGASAAGLQAAVNAGRIVQSGGVAGRTVGVYDNGTGVVVGYAAHGDGDLDGAVTVVDINRLVAAGFRGGPMNDATWQTGDFDHDGTTTISDVNLVVSEGLLTRGPHDAGDGVPRLIVDLATGRATLDTAGRTLTAIQVQSRGPNGTLAAAGDGDGLLLAGKCVPGQFVFANASRDEVAASFGTLADGVYDLGVLFDPSRTSLPLTAPFVLNDLRFGFNGDATGSIRFTAVP